MAPTSGGFTDLQSYEYLYGFNELHGHGPTLAAIKNPITSTVDGISGLMTFIPRPVIKVNLPKLSFKQM